MLKRLFIVEADQLSTYGSQNLGYKKPSVQEGDSIKVGLVNLVWYSLSFRRSSFNFGKSPLRCSVKFKV